MPCTDSRHSTQASVMPGASHSSRSPKPCSARDSLLRCRPKHLSDREFSRLESIALQTISACFRPSPELASADQVEMQVHSAKGCSAPRHSCPRRGQYCNFPSPFFPLDCNRLCFPAATLPACYWHSRHFENGLDRHGASSATSYRTR